MMMAAAQEERTHCFNGDEIPHNTSCRFNPQLHTKGCSDFSHLVGCGSISVPLPRKLDFPLTLASICLLACLVCCRQFQLFQFSCNY